MATAIIGTDTTDRAACQNVQGLRHISDTPRDYGRAGHQCLAGNVIGLRMHDLDFKAEIGEKTWGILVGPGQAPTSRHEQNTV